MVLQQANVVRTKAAELNLIKAQRKNELRRLLAEEAELCCEVGGGPPRTTVAYAHPIGRRVATTQPPHSQAHRGKDRNDAGKLGAFAKASGVASIQKPPAKNCEVRNAVATIATTTTIPAATVAHPVPTKSLTSYDAYVLFVFAFPKNDNNDFESI